MMTVLNKEMQQLQIILDKYQVDNPEQIEAKIREGKIPEHPAFEEYLSALSFQNAIAEMKQLAKRLIEDF